MIGTHVAYCEKNTRCFKDISALQPAKAQGKTVKNLEFGHSLKRA